MSDDVVQGLVEAVRFARIVAAVLPVDDEADAMVARVLAANRPARMAPRILSRKAAP